MCAFAISSNIITIYFFVKNCGVPSFRTPEVVAGKYLQSTCSITKAVDSFSVSGKRSQKLLVYNVSFVSLDLLSFSYSSDFPLGCNSFGTNRSLRNTCEGESTLFRSFAPLLYLYLAHFFRIDVHTSSSNMHRAAAVHEENPMGGLGIINLTGRRYS